tara:strand:+ start:6021 stop:7430 length:1410 start_codon:yes stop_codon:yes gene_type:complete
MMYRACKTTHDIVFKTEDVKVGRGKNSKVIQRRKYNFTEDIETRTIESLKYYKDRMKRESKIKYRDYQKKIIVQGAEVVLLNRFLYLAMEVRTGKTLTSMGIAKLMNCKNVLFLTKKKAISSIESDYELLYPDFELTVTNYESLHKVEDVSSYDMLVLDEAHSMGAFPKPSKRAKQVRDIISKNNPYVILLSGTPTPESYSQMYHQVWGIKTNPFKEFTNFYKFSKKFVNVKQRKINGMMMNDYKDGMISILSEMNKYTISYTQKQAGFKVDTREHTLKVPMSELTYKLTARLKKDLVIEGKDETILGDTPVKLMMKLHQMFSGTVKFESGKSTILDLTKAEFIHDNFGDAKVGIFYKFKEELKALKQVYGDQLCTELSTFESTDKSIALQIVSGREGISLRQAEALVYYNIDFSATSYWQSRDRMTTKERLESDVYWVFSEGGIEEDIYKAVSKKKDFTVNHFKQLYK